MVFHAGTLKDTLALQVLQHNAKHPSVRITPTQLANQPPERPSDQQQPHTRLSANSTPKGPLRRPQGRPPATPSFLPSLAAVPNPFLSDVNRVLDSCLAKSTLSGYAAAVTRFWAFCDAARIEIGRRFPTEEEVLAAYAASFASFSSGSTAASAFAALKTWHALHNKPWAGGPRLNYVLRGVTNLAPVTSKKVPRKGIDRHDLCTLHDALDLSNPFDAAVYAAATIAFWAQCRLGELLGSARLKHDPSRFPSRSSISGTPISGASTFLHLPRTKTAQRSGEKVYITVQHGRADPIYALANHLRVNSRISSSAHLFAFRSQPGGPTRCLIKEAFLKRCNEVWAAHGVPRITGHCFRIGGTNEFLRQGVPPEVVKEMGRWKSNAFFVYWRDTNTVAARHAERIHYGPRPDTSRAGPAGGLAR